MTELSEDAVKVLRKCRDLGFCKEGEAIQPRNYITEFENIEDAKTAHGKLVAEGICEASERYSVKLTAKGATLVQKL